ncbi:unnamed protein product, partial [Brassica oleracea var. botrytis]
MTKVIAYLLISITTIFYDLSAQSHSSVSAIYSLDKIDGPGEFSGSYSLPLPVGSVLVLKGNGADVAKHCVPAVPQKRISITFRKMDESKIPVGFTPDFEKGKFLKK